MSSPVTEVAAFEAILNGDRERAIELLEDSFPSELDSLSDALESLESVIDEVRRGKSAR
jgi:hypothetical protein